MLCDCQERILWFFDLRCSVENSSIESGLLGRVFTVYSAVVYYVQCLLLMMASSKQSGVLKLTPKAFFPVIFQLVVICFFFYLSRV